MEWSTEEKEKIFDILSARYYKKKFWDIFKGRLRSSDVQLLHRKNGKR